MQAGPSAALTVLQLTHQGDGAGSTQSILSLSVHLQRRGHRVLVGCRPDTLLARHAREQGLEIVPLDFGRLGPLAAAIARTVREARVDIVNSHASRDRRACTWLRWTRRLPQPLVVTRRTMPLTSPAEVLAVGLTADRTIAVSNAVARALRRRLHPAGPLRVVHNGIDLGRVDPPPTAGALAAARAALGDLGGRPVVVVVARRKDQHLLLAQLAHVERPLALVFVGIERDAELAAVERGVPERHLVRYIPFTERPIAFYHLAAAAALPTRIEGFSQSLLEAMALGLPVVATGAGGNGELITDGETGLLVPVAEPQLWARALDQLLGEPERARRLGAAGRALVRAHYTIERTAERTEAVYREAATLR